MEAFAPDVVLADDVAARSNDTGDTARDELYERLQRWVVRGGGFDQYGFGLEDSSEGVEACCTHRIARLWGGT